jgi:hypothetical protein
MTSVVIYGSHYGTAKQYAEELARRAGIEVRQYDSVGDINKYGIIAYIGALYAGGVRGMKKTFASTPSVGRNGKLGAGAIARIEEPVVGGSVTVAAAW